MRTAWITLALCTATPAAAERAVTVELDDHAPFSRADLTSALRVRLEPTGEPVRVAVVATASGVTVRTRGHEREVLLDATLHGPAAARLVALVAGDLLLDDLAAAPMPPRAAQPAERMTVGAYGGGSLWSDVMAGAMLDVAIPWGAWLVTIEAGGAQLLDPRLAITSATFRNGVGRRFDRLELRAGATIAPIMVREGTGDTTILFGIGGSARVRLALTDELRFVLAAGADAFATRTHYHKDTMTVSTPWFAPWVAIGMELTP